jgi:type II secretory ATPase GspE/PulE/Tfp pilus assembly ATPase PilB-like protein
MSEKFKWPVPSYYELIDSGVAHQDDGSAPAAVVTMKDGRWQAGLLLDLAGSAGQINFMPKRGKEAVALRFDAIKSIRLTEPIALTRLQLSQQSANGNVQATTQKCIVHFKEGEPLQGDTAGYLYEPYGLFIYLMTQADNVLRWFIPADAMMSYQIGEQLGKMLLDEQLVTLDAITTGLEIQENLRANKLGDYLKRQNIVTQAQLEDVLQRQKNMPQVRLGEALMQEQLITDEQLQNALALQAKDRKMPLGDILVQMQVVTLDNIKRVLAQKLGIPFVGLRTFQFEPNVIKAVPGEFVRKHVVMPMYRTETRMVVAMENPLATQTLQALGILTKLKIDPVMASLEDLSHVIEQFYGGLNDGENIAELVSELGTGGSGPGSFDLVLDNTITDSDNVLVRLVNKIIVDASEQGVSDIHIESMKGNRPTRVRFRKDGVLSTYSEIPANFRNALISRIKIMSRLDISEKRHSQDGKINFEQFGPAKVELRVVTMPTTEGLEDIVMRILAAPKAVSIDSLGLAPYALEGLKKLAHKPHGLMFVCGPTGSGKTTTLHAMLAFINTPERKIWTVEDPIEITQDGLRQVQVQARIDWTFAAVLRSFMRADPDVIMVGETRDPETAKTVIEASLTGHLVFSTMHTNSAAESVVRLLDFGLDPFNFADALQGVVGQRLARRLCTQCRTVHTATEEELDKLAFEYCFETELDAVEVRKQWQTSYGGKTGKIHLYAAPGCERCGNSGYKGRVGIHELLISTAAIRKKILARATVVEILHAAMAEGMRTIKQDGIEKILQGHTDWDQIKAM